MSHRTGYKRVNTSLIEESVMDNIAWLVPGLLVPGRTSTAGRRTARR
jgi:hypothetical protein